ncbi:MAG: glycosyltransferase [Motiliproteus sp.]
MKKLLIVAYLFPPTATTGVHRAAKFVKYIGEFGWQVTVITADNRVTLAQDNSLCTDFPDDLRVIKIASFERTVVQRYIDHALGFFRLRDLVGEAVAWRLGRFYRNREIPDQHAPWGRQASKRAVKLFESESFDAVLTTSWPYSDHLVGLALMEKFGTPWIADFRDPWIGNSNYQRPEESVIGKAERRLERDIVNSSSAVLGVTDHMVATFRESYPEIIRSHFKLVRNGYDLDDLPRVNSIVKTAPLIIAFVGSFYRNRSPLVMIKALSKLSLKGIACSDIQVVFVGGMGGHDCLFEEYSVDGYCQTLGYQPAKECYRLIADCHALWFQSTDEDNFAVPGKVYEYMAMNKTIIASVPKNTETMEILHKAGSVFQVDPENYLVLADVIYDLVVRKKTENLSCERDSGYVEQFSRREQTKNLAGILDEICNDNKVENNILIDLKIKEY